MPTITVHATKGGQGTTTITAALGILHANAGHRTVLIDTGHDLPAILDRPDHNPTGLANYLNQSNITLADITTHISDNLDLIPRGTGLIEFDTYTYGLIIGALAHYDTILIDAGTNTPQWHRHADRNILVIRPCYLAIRNAVGQPRPTDLIVMNEPGRALTPNDIETVLGMPITATIPVDERTTRIIDAGLLTARLPRPLIRALRRLTPPTRPTETTIEVAR